MELTPNQKKMWFDHAMEQYPREAVGVISNGWYKELENISEDDNAFKVDSKALHALENVTALLHSHCVDVESDEATRNRRAGFNESTPSMPDVLLQKQLNIPFGIITTSGEWCQEPIWLGDEPEPLIGRKFLYHVNDCHQIVRRFFELEYDIILPDHHAEYNWWHTATNGGEYLNKFEEYGFTEIDQRLTNRGDVFLIQFKANCPNHLAVNMGGGKILHHMVGQLSMEADFSRWSPYVVKTLRYDFD